MIKIAGKEYKYKLTLSSALIYCKKRKCELHQYQEDLTKVNLESFTIEGIEIVRDLIYSCIKAADESAEVKESDIVDEFSNPDFLVKFFEAFNQSNPRPEKEEKEVKKKVNMGSNRRIGIGGIKFKPGRIIQLILPKPG